MNAPQDLHPINSRHIDVAKQNIDIAFLESAQRRFSVRRDLDTVTQSLEFLLQYHPKICLIFGDQNSCYFLFAQTYGSPSWLLRSPAPWIPMSVA